MRVGMLYDDRPEPGSRPRPRGSARRCPRPRGARSTARRRARRRRRECRRARPWRGSSRRCCSSRCRRSRGCRAARARADDRVDRRPASRRRRASSPRPWCRARRCRSHPRPRYSWHSRSIASTSTAPCASNGVISGTQTPRRSRSLVMRASVLGRTVPFPGHTAARQYLPRRAAVARDRDHRCSSASRPECCRACSASAAPSSRRPRSGRSAPPRSRRSARRCRRSCRRRSRARCATSRESFILPRVVVAHLRVRRARLRSSGSRLSGAVPGNGHALMILTAAARRVHRVPHRVPDASARSSAPGQPLDDEWWRLAIIGVAAGALSGLLGIGGGILMVPAFSAWVGMPLQGDDRDVARVRRRSSRSPARSRTGTSATSTGRSRSRSRSA